MGGRRRPSEPRDGSRVMLRPIDLVELVIPHAGFRARFCDGKRAIGATPAAAKGFRTVVGVADRDQVQASIASADIAAHEQRPIGLAQRTEAIGNTGKGTDHEARLGPSGGQCRINFLPAVLAR
jgi:hypothetical protein